MPTAPSITTTRTIIAALALALACACVSCAHDLEARADSGDALQERLGGDDAGRWSIKLPRAFKGWEVYAAGECALVFGWTTSPKGESSRRLSCYKADSGALAWSYKTELDGGVLEDRIFVVGEVAIYINPNTATGISLETGEPVWTFEARDRRLKQPFVAGGQLYLSLDHKDLVALDANTGVWRAGFTIPQDHKLLIVTEPVDDAKVPQLVFLHTSDVPQRHPHALVAYSSTLAPDTTRGATSAPPYATPVEVWRLQVRTRAASLHQIGDTLLGMLANRELWGVDPDSGELLYREAIPRSFASRKRKRRGSQGVTISGWPPRFTRKGGSRGGLAELDPLLQGSRLPQDARVMIERGQLLLTQAQRLGIVMEMLHIERRDPRTLDLEWSLALGWRDTIHIKRELPELGLTVLANRRLLAVVDTESGELLAQRKLPKRARQWKSIATNGRSIFLIFNRNKRPRLEGYPL